MASSPQGSLSSECFLSVNPVIQFMSGRLFPRPLPAQYYSRHDLYRCTYYSCFIGINGANDSWHDSLISISPPSKPLEHFCRRTKLPRQCQCETQPSLKSKWIEKRKAGVTACAAQFGLPKVLQSITYLVRGKLQLKPAQFYTT